jgi:NAD-dependent DNA ligase
MARVNAMTDMATVIEVMEVTGAFNGKRFSITGHLGRKRADIVKIIETAGGHFDKAPDWGTDFLITNKDWTAETVQKGASKKLIRAQERGVKIISEQTFYDMLCSQGETAATVAEAEASG